MALGARGGEDVREGVPDRDPTAPTRVQRPRRVRRDELEVDPLTLELAAATPVVAALHHDPQHVMEPAGGDREVEETPGDLDAGEVRWAGLEQRGLEALRGLDGGHAGGVSHLE